MFNYPEPSVTAFGELQVSRGYGVLGGQPSASDSVGGDSAHDGAYRDVTVNELRERIASFQAQPLETLSDDALRDGVYNILLGRRGRSITFLRSKIRIEAGQSFFRGRWISDVDDQLKTSADVREPKPHFVAKAGRLNTSGESILYTSLGTPQTAFLECRFEVGDMFAMSRFVARDSFDVTVVGVDPLLLGLSEEEGQKLQLIQDFLDQSFTYKAGPDNLEPYRLTRLLATELWYLPPRTCKGWAFRSTLDPSGRGWNVCFEPDRGRQALLYKDTQVFELQGTDDIMGQPKAHLTAAFKGARNDRLSRLSAAEFSQTRPWI